MCAWSQMDGELRTPSSGREHATDAAGRVTVAAASSAPQRGLRLYVAGPGPHPRQRLLPGRGTGCGLPHAAASNPDFDELGVPESVYLLLDRHQGLILVTGPTGSREVDDAGSIDRDPRPLARCGTPSREQHSSSG